MTTTGGLRRLRPYFDEVCVRAGEQVAAEGRLCHQFFIVVEGELRSCRGGQAGRLGPGDEFGWEAMRERGVNEATVYALTDSRLLVTVSRKRCAYSNPAAEGSLRSATTSKPARRKASTVRKRCALEAFAGTLTAASMRSFSRK